MVNIIHMEKELVLEFNQHLCGIQQTMMVQAPSTEIAIVIINI